MLPRRFAFRLRATSRRLRCQFRLPGGLAPAGFASELVLVASAGPPRLRRLIVHRRLADPGASSQDPPDAA